jgi:hypothetical protein
MVEIAISLGVIAIALVAIIGVMPTGLRVQQENREDTLLNQDAMLWLEALRSGRPSTNRVDPAAGRGFDWPTGIDYLTNHVLAVAVTNVVDGALLYLNPYLLPTPKARDAFPLFGRVRTGYGPVQRLANLTNGLHIIGLLGRPKLEVRTDGSVITNYVAALVRGISGPASQRGSVGQELSFTYLLTCEVVPFGGFGGNLPREWIDYGDPGISALESQVRSNRFVAALNHGANFNEIRLALNGPAIEAKRVQFESGRDEGRRWETFGSSKVFRTVASGRQFSYEVDRDKKFVVWYVLPGEFRRVEP